MTFPTGLTVPTENLDSGTDSPAAARVDILQAVEYLNEIIASENIPNGVCVLNSSGEIASSQMPTSITTISLSLTPTDRVVNIQDVLRLTALPAGDVSALSSSQLGDIVVSDDADSGNAAVCFYDGEDWRYLSLSSLPSL